MSWRILANFSSDLVKLEQVILKIRPYVTTIDVNANDDKENKGHFSEKDLIEMLLYNLQHIHK